MEWLQYNALGHKLRFPQGKKAQFVTVMGITIHQFSLKEEAMKKASRGKVKLLRRVCSTSFRCSKDQNVVAKIIEEQISNAFLLKPPPRA
jgi:hypothetical protein